MSRLPPGIRRRHARSCTAVESDDMEVCGCRPSYQAQAGPRGRRQTRTWPTLAAAVGWKRDVEQAFARGHVLATAPSLGEAVGEWLTLADRGVVLARGDKPYRPSTLRGYRRALEHELRPAFGDRRLDQVGRGELNRFIERLQARGLAASTVRNVVVPLRAVYRRALAHEVVVSNPTAGVKVPGGSGRRLRVATAVEIPKLLEAVEARDRPLWATALYAGLRRGELQALRWADVDLAGGMIRVSVSYDAGSGTTGPVKSQAGQNRRLPVVGQLRDELVAHRQRAGGRPGGLVFARGALAGTCRRASSERPFSDQAVATRAQRRWAAAGVAPVTLHECRHTFASLMIEAMAQEGVFNPKALQQMLGHASIQQTYDRYGHLFPGTEASAGRMLDGYLADSRSPARELWVAASRVLVLLDEISQNAALPAVAHLKAGLESWEHQRPVLPSAACNPVEGTERPAAVPRARSGRID